MPLDSLDAAIDEVVDTVAWNYACEELAKECDRLAKGAISHLDSFPGWADGAFACRDACRARKKEFDPGRNAALPQEEPLEPNTTTQA